MVEINIEEDQWWPSHDSWPEYPEREIKMGDGKSFKHRLCEDQAMALLLLEGYVSMLNAGGQCGLFVNCNDVFFPASADAEPMPPVGFGKDEIFWELYDLVRLHGWIGSVKWCSIRRKLKPLNRYLNEIRDAGLWCEKMDALP